jgi:hypothetical protein
VHNRASGLINANKWESEWITKLTSAWEKIEC